MNFKYTYFKTWKDFLYQRTPVLPFCVFRILLGMFLVFNNLILFSDFDIWYSDFSVVTPQLIKLYNYSFYDLSQMTPPLVMKLVFAVNFITSISFFAGYKTKTSNFIVLLTLIIIHLKNPLILQGSDNLIRMLLIYLLFAKSGKLLSIDSYLRQKKVGFLHIRKLAEVKDWNLSLFLIQLQLCILYTTAALSKLMYKEWFDGTAVWYTLNNSAYTRLPSFMQSIEFSQLFTPLTLYIELFLALAIWIKRLRPLFLITGIGLHISFEIFLSVSNWQYIMISCYFIFIPAEYYKKCSSFLIKKATHIRAIYGS